MNEENLKIGMYTENEIFKYMTEQEGGMLGRSMYDAIFDKMHALITEIEQLKNENKQLKEKLEQRDNIINKLIEIKYNFQNENSLFIFENDVLLKFMNDLQYIFNSKIRSDK